MKQLKDYLHLYLGCECILVHRRGIYQIAGVNINTSYVQITGQNTEPINFIKPILRPLSDMTEDEMKEYSTMQPPAINSLTRYPIEAAFYTHWLLSKHFDLFGLIEAGLAIDKTTLK